jgi:hypothetical protein
MVLYFSRGKVGFEGKEPNVHDLSTQVDNIRENKGAVGAKFLILCEGKHCELCRLL